MTVWEMLWAILLLPSPGLELRTVARTASDAARRAASVRLSAGIVDGTDGVRGAFEIV